MSEEKTLQELTIELRRLLGFEDDASPTVGQIYESAIEDIKDERKALGKLRNDLGSLNARNGAVHKELNKTKALLSKLEEEDERLQEELLCAKSKIDSLCAIGKKQAEHLDIQLGIIEAQAEALKGWSNDQK